MDGNTRRLPPWMLTGASSDVPAKSNRTDKTSVEVKRKHEPEEKAEKRRRRIVKPKERDDSEESKEMGIKTRGKERERSKIGEDEAKPRIGVGKNQEIILSVTGPEDEEDLTVDDLLSFAQEYVKCEEDRTIKDREGPVVIVDESNTTSSLSQGETKEPNQTRDPTAQDMLSLLLGPYFKKPHQ